MNGRTRKKVTLAHTGSSRSPKETPASTEIRAKLTPKTVSYTHLDVYKRQMVIMDEIFQIGGLKAIGFAAEQNQIGGI